MHCTHGRGYETVQGSARVEGGRCTGVYVLDVTYWSVHMCETGRDRGGARQEQECRRGSEVLGVGHRGLSGDKT